MPISRKDIQRLARSDDHFADPFFRQYLRLVLNEKLKAPKGRKPDALRSFKLVMADVLIEDRAAEIRVPRRTAGRKRTGRLAPGAIRPGTSELQLLEVQRSQSCTDSRRPRGVRFSKAPTRLT
jgi:hypothetical protein